MKVSLYKKGRARTGCLLCGKPLVYSAAASLHTCAICGGSFEANAACEAGHYVCDDCHTSSAQDFLSILRRSSEKDPVRLFDRIAALDGVHMHGPEHHSIVPCVMLTAYRNNGGDIDLVAAFSAASKRAGQVPGGACGYWGACGAAIGAGIYASIVTGSNPLNAKAWGVPQALAARCLERNAKLGGPRCCKRSSRIAIEEAVRFTEKQLGIVIPTERTACAFHSMNRECLHARCPYYGGATD